MTNGTHIRNVLQDLALRCVGPPATGGQEIQDAAGDARVYAAAREGMKIEEVARTGVAPAQLQSLPLWMLAQKTAGPKPDRVKGNGPTEGGGSAPAMPCPGGGVGRRQPARTDWRLLTETIH